MSFPTKHAIATAVALAIMAPISMTAGAAPMKLALAPSPVDLGLAPSTDVKDITLSLKIVNRVALEQYIASTADPKSPNFRKFLTPEQFAATYGQSAAAIEQVRSFLAAQGVVVTDVASNNLLVSARATNAQLVALFGAPIHSFRAQGTSYQRPLGTVALPAALQGVIGSVAGLSDQALYKPHRTSTAHLGQTNTPNLTLPTPGKPATGVPASYTVADLAQQSNIAPLYARGIDGTGSTLGIMTFASFKTADVSAYWKAVGLSADTSRITVVKAGGGTISTNGADETTLDVEQSGGVAPGAKIIVYEAANTDAGSLALYTQAITDNKVDTLSISWGLFEIAYGPDDLAAYDNLFLQAAAQGIPISASTGDAGAYDVNANQGDPLDYSYPKCSMLLSVDFPASSPYVLGAGGTTLPGVLHLSKGDVAVPNERPWGWDYLRDYIVHNNNLSYYYANVFPVGAGGGVSVQYAVPSYQAGLVGVKTSAPSQSLLCLPPAVPNFQDLVDMPAGVAGRNLPDVSLNADPETGYLLYYSGQWLEGNGGTSFVAPQLNGVFALITQQLRAKSGDASARIGFPHPQLYSAFKAKGYAAGSPFRAISSGDNLYWTAAPNYNPASGLGSLDIDNLANTLAP